MPFLRVYTASKTKHAAKWRVAQQNWEYIHVTSRWIKQVILDGGDLFEKNDSSKKAARCWIEDIEDIKASDYLLLYAEEGEHLRGGLVEAGVALSKGIPVIVIGNHPDYGSWKYHPLVTQLHDLDSLLVWAKAELQLRMKNL